MSFRRQMILMILAIVFFTIILNSLILGQFVNQHFQRYIETQYDERVENITEYAQYILSNDIVDIQQTNKEMGKYLKDMITSIGVYDENNALIIKLQQKSSNMHMMTDREPIEDFIYPISNDEQVIGYVLIRRIERFGASPASQLFFSAIVRISFMAVFITLILSLISIFFLSKRMTRDLNRTAKMAEDIDELGNLTYKESSTHEISAIQKKLIEQASKIRLKQKIRKEKADQLAHEARTPLTILKTSIEGVKDGVVEMDEDRLDLWIHEVDRLSKIVEDVGGILRLGEDDPIVDIKPVLIGELIDKVIRSIKPQFEHQGISLDFEQSDNELMVSTDSNLLSQSLYNLLVNALKFTPEGGMVIVASGVINQNVRISVQDNGIGVDEDELEEVFSAYHRGRNGKNIEGQGMGLHIVRKNITALGGNVKLMLNSDKGLTAIMEFKDIK
jgi:signal transduction histidine kinase